jgi:hypothetical protein
MKRKKATMDRRIFATKILHYQTRAQWDFILADKKNASYRKAKLISTILSTPIGIWLARGSKRERQDAWKKYSAKFSSK